MGRVATALATGAVLSLLPGLGGCTDDRDDAGAVHGYQGRLVQGDVEVVVRVRRHDLTATFTPRRSGFHVYSVDLPAAGVQGLGVPTRVQPSGGATATGDLVADQPVRSLDYPSLGLTLPVYPDGPVTLRLAVERSRSEPEVRVTYAACSEALCLPPVRDARVPLHR
jgi:cytochrome c biogenesis DsbD-like protein